MIVRAGILAVAATIAVVGFAVDAEAVGGTALLWALAAAGDFLWAVRARRQLKADVERTTEEMAATNAFAQDAYHGFHMIAEAAPVFVWTSDADARIDFVNRAMRDFFGLGDKHDLDWRTTLHPEDLVVSERYVADLLTGIEPAPLFTRVRRHDGEWRWMFAVARAQGNPVRRLIGMGIDATAWKDAEHELAELLEAKQNFLSVMSHELRTPLAAIIGFCELLKEGLPVPLPEEDLESVERIGDAAMRLQTLVDEVLLFNSLETAEERVHPLPINPTECVVAVQELLQPRARHLGLAIAIDVTYAPKIMNTDGTKLRRALANLVHNALKFTRKGTVTIRVIEDEKVVRFAVIDPGIGIDTQSQRHVFEPFWQQRQSMVREVGGLGLGLAICHRIATLLGGSITVESQPEHGSTFTLVLPK